jgi:hypothetical protein
MAEDLSRRFAASLRGFLRTIALSVEPPFADEPARLAGRVDALVRSELQRTSEELLQAAGAGLDFGTGGLGGAGAGAASIAAGGGASDAGGTPLSGSKP